ncbi:MAG TPA: LysR family transcriptional regulator [Solirubrobacteraceae bacterium]|nr:LysR family transcriptional regulator [Solirubrobacteraceae bacterium]
MTLQQLEYFLAAAEHGSFSAAAEQLHLAQPSLSEQVRKLESELGVALFTRVGRGIVLTEAGRELRPHAERTLEEAEVARDSVRDVRELRGGIATFGTWGTARFFPGSDFIADFRRRYPGVRVRIVGQNSSDVVAQVREGQLEAGMVVLPIEDRGLEVRPMLEDELVYVSAIGARVRRPMTIEQLAQAPLILSDASYGTEDPTRRHLSQLAQRAGVSITPEIDVEDVEAAIDLTARGLGDTIVSRGTLLALGRRVPRRLGWIPFDPPVYDTYAFIWRRGGRPSPATREFLRLAEQRLAAQADALRTRPPRRRRPGG